MDVGIYLGREKDAITQNWREQLKADGRWVEALAASPRQPPQGECQGNGWFYQWSSISTVSQCAAFLNSISLGCSVLHNTGESAYWGRFAFVVLLWVCKSYNASFSTIPWGDVDVRREGKLSWLLEVRYYEEEGTFIYCRWWSCRVSDVVIKEKAKQKKRERCLLNLLWPCCDIPIRTAAPGQWVYKTMMGFRRSSCFNGGLHRFTAKLYLPNTWMMKWHGCVELFLSVRLILNDH